MYKVLVVEDEDLDFVNVKHFLRSGNEDFDIERASSFDEALRLINEKKYDVYLIDCRLGSDNGLDLLSHERLVNEAAPAIILTGHFSQEVGRNAMQKGAADFIPKHELSSSLLDRVITQAIERKGVHYQARQRQKLESIGRLSAGVAHEINIPAQFVSNSVYFIRDGLADVVKLLTAYQEQLKLLANESQYTQEMEALLALEKDIDIEYLLDELPLAADQATDGVSRITHIVKAMNAFARRDCEKKESTNLNQIIENSTTVCRHEWRYLAELDFDFDSELTSVMCFPQELGQVMINLVVNAAHAIEEANVGTTEPGNIRIETQKDGDKAIIRISDTGVGMPEDVRKRIFDPFFTTKAVGKGSGQGLSMVYTSVVKRHEGQIEVASSPLQGTTFTITIPIGQASVTRIDKKNAINALCYKNNHEIRCSNN